MDYTAAEQAEHRKKLVEALRSGKYRQGRGQLRTGDYFCCLGVACEISGLVTWDKTLACTESDQIGEHAILPTEVMDWIGFASNTGAYAGEDDEDGNQSTSLIAMNDDGASFALIADVIEREPPDLLDSTVS